MIREEVKVANEKAPPRRKGFTILKSIKDKFPILGGLKEIMRY